MIALIETGGNATHRLAAACRQRGAAVEIVAIGSVTPASLAGRARAVIIPPAPLRQEILAPATALVEACQGRTPLLGIGLGMLALARAAGEGGTVLTALAPGSRVELIHDETGIYEAVPSPMAAGVFEVRSLEEGRIPAGLTISAHTLGGEIMGIRSADGGLEGIRFDPVSLLTPRGGDLLANFLERAGEAPHRISA